MTRTSVPYPFPPRPLADLVHRLQARGLLLESGGHMTEPIDHLAFDSRAVGPGGLFVAVRGERADGHLFIDKAVQNGANAIACEATPSAGWPEGVARMLVTDSRRALADLAACCHGDPSHHLDVIGVTGTNGKTTTAWLCAQALDALDRPCGYVGTLGMGRTAALESASHTTPDAITLQGFLHHLADRGVAAAAVEVSSHALDQHRTTGTRFDVGVFTNLTRDHLDYHKDFDSYAAAKRLLFLEMSSGGTAVVNADDAYARIVTGGTPPRCVGFGTSPGADVRYSVLSDGVEGLRLRLDGREQRFRLAGSFNAANLAAAYAAIVALGTQGSDAASALAEARPAPGRFEPVPASECAAFIVDYAHTPDALEHVLRAARRLVRPGGSLWCVFGCGGNRDAGKRPQMGRVAEEESDRVVVTSDNPRDESPEAILSGIRDGMARPDDALWIVDRREAIARAAREAAADDVVVVAGKGHEAVQVIRGERLPFDDREIVLESCGGGH